MRNSFFWMSLLFLSTMGDLFLREFVSWLTQVLLIEIHR
jgi:hypothetical protein